MKMSRNKASIETNFSFSSRRSAPLIYGPFNIHLAGSNPRTIIHESWFYDHVRFVVDNFIKWEMARANRENL